MIIHNAECPGCRLPKGHSGDRVPKPVIPRQRTRN